MRDVGAGVKEVGACLPLFSRGRCFRDGVWVGVAYCLKEGWRSLEEELQQEGGLKLVIWGKKKL